jgi:hypothetical protein
MINTLVLTRPACDLVVQRRLLADLTRPDSGTPNHNLAILERIINTFLLEYNRIHSDRK